jgi:hypothetical protein
MTWNFLRSAPMAESRTTLFLLRLIVCLLVWDTHSGWLAHWDEPLQALQAMVVNPLQFDMVYESQPHPNGIAQWVDLTILSDNRVEIPLRILTLISIIAYLWNVPAWLSLAVPTLFGIAAGTLSNSQGSIGHITQMLHCTLLCLWLGDLWRLLFRRGLTSLAVGQLQAHIGRQAIAAGYVVSALTKLVETRGMWIANARYAPLQMVKNNDMKFYQDLDPSFQTLNGLAQTMMEHPALSQLLFGLGLPLELLAFLACVNRPLSWMVGGTLLFFHIAVLQLMSLFFPFNMGLLLAFFVLPGLLPREPNHAA